MRREILSLLGMAFVGVALYVVYFAIAHARNSLGFADYGRFLALAIAMFAAGGFIIKKSL